MEALEPDSKSLLLFYLIDLVYRCELLSYKTSFNITLNQRKHRRCKLLLFEGKINTIKIIKHKMN